MELQDKILEYLTHHPGARKREVAGFLKIWQCDFEFLAAFAVLQSFGLIFPVRIQDMANMEYYDEWYVAF